MAYHPRIECEDIPSFQTTRARNSELRLVNNPALEDAAIGYAARYAPRYHVWFHGLAIEGNHIHKAAIFPEAHRAHFMRDFNSTVAGAAPRHQPKYPGGGLGARRYSSEHLVAAPDLKETFFISSFNQYMMGWSTILRINGRSITTQNVGIRTSRSMS